MTSPIRLTDFREILNYVPHFRDSVFVIAIDGEIAAGPHLLNLLLDAALLSNLNIRIVLTHGAAYQVAAAANERGVDCPRPGGDGPVSEELLELAIESVQQASHQVFSGLAQAGVRAVSVNALAALPKGVLQGVDWGRAGRVERLDAGLLGRLLREGVTPVLSPVGFDRQGKTYYLDSDELAVEAAAALHAKKVIFAAPHNGVEIQGQLKRQLTVPETERLLQQQEKMELSTPLASKLRCACAATRRGVERVHVIDGRLPEGLLAEVFSHQGVGTLVHHDNYAAIRTADENDTAAILELLQQASLKDEVRDITAEAISRRLSHYYVCEVEGEIVACAALHPYPRQNMAELASFVVDRKRSGGGIGRRLVAFLEKQARQQGVRELFCLSTQAFHYFKHKAGFEESGPHDLPPERLEEWRKGGRNSKVLKKLLA